MNCLLFQIEEPKTPYSHGRPTDTEVEFADREMEIEPLSENEADRPDHGAGINAASLASRLIDEKQHPHGQKMIRVPSHDNDDDEVDESEMTPEEREKRRQFKEHRKHHYNEYEMVKKAKELLRKEGIDPMENERPPEDTHMSS